MKVVYLDKNDIKENSVCAIGFFDGVHIAHKELIKETVRIGKERKKPTGIITFDVHPKSVLFDLDYYYLTPLQRKIELLSEFEIDYLYIIHFTKERSILDPTEFIETYLKNISTLVCGFDFRFGVRGSGTIETLKQSNQFELKVIDEIVLNYNKVGSSHIRDLLRSGKVDLVKDILGDYYSVSGEVIHGAAQGRQLGFPTANINFDDYFIPKKGVYATLTKVQDKWYHSVSSVGYNPTVNTKVYISLESHIIDFNEDIYGEEITVKFISRIRDEIKFETLDDLIIQIGKDKKESRELLSSLHLI